MRVPGQAYQRIALAALPLMLYSENLWQGFIMAVLTTAGFWAGVVLFWLTSNWITEKLLRVVLLSWLVILAELAWAYLGILPLWTISVIFLAPFEETFREKKKRGAQMHLFGSRTKQAFLTGCGFVLFVSLWSALNEFVAWHSGSEEEVLAGAFFTLFILSWVLKQVGGAGTK